MNDLEQRLRELALGPNDPDAREEDQLMREAADALLHLTEALRAETALSGLRFDEVGILRTRLSHYKELEKAGRELDANIYDITTNGHFVNKCVERRDIDALRTAITALTNEEKG